MKTSSFITSSLAALAVVGSATLVFAQTTTTDMPATTTTPAATPGTQTTPMATPPVGGMTTPAPTTTDSMNNNAAMNEPVARADRN
ncbi:hypothetical protein [Hydrogenophaga sp.]|uniref:hypothetical protein n=1 Tax=Hydrogenophaga sp. TaxID=1904254 RepID=UPI00262FFC33|nr:hypothetical protein [Hydrogenophaga sp.]